MSGAFLHYPWQPSASRLMRSGSSLARRNVRNVIICFLYSWPVRDQLLLSISTPHLTSAVFKFPSSSFAAMRCSNGLLLSSLTFMRDCISCFFWSLPTYPLYFLCAVFTSIVWSPSFLFCFWRGMFLCFECASLSPFRTFYLSRWKLIKLHAFFIWSQLTLWCIPSSCNSGSPNFFLNSCLISALWSFSTT